MSDRRIDILKLTLEARRAELAAVFRATDPSTREVVPRDGAWSVAMVIEHLAQTEQAVAKALVAAARSLTPRSGEDAFDATEFSRHVEMPGFLDRTRKLRLAQPSGSLSAADAWTALEASRVALFEALDGSVGLRLEDSSRDHPAGGTLDGYQWVAFVGYMSRDMQLR
jgi:hypothetical protein